MYIPCEASSWTLLHQKRKLSSRISLQNQLFCLCRLPAVLLAGKGNTETKLFELLQCFQSYWDDNWKVVIRICTGILSINLIKIICLLYPFFQSPKKKKKKQQAWLLLHLMPIWYLYSVCQEELYVFII